MTMPLDLDRRVELFVDDQAVQALRGDAKRTLRRPEPREVVLTTDQPWEGNTCGYYAILRDGDRWRMYYRGSQAKVGENGRSEVTCLVESSDGIVWTRPSLQMFQWPGAAVNNIVWMGKEAHNLAPFIDGHPATPAAQRYKALGRSAGPRPLVSPDGVHWSLHSEEPLVTDGAFDSQNHAFWDDHRREYRMYWRIKPQKVRGIRTAVTGDFMQWGGEHPDVTYTDMPAAVPGDPSIELYTSAIQPYFRGPHLFIGFPTRFYKDDQHVEPLLMTSRDGVHFHRWLEPVIPTSAPEERAGNRSNYMAWGMVYCPDRPREISVYGTERYYGPHPSRLRRFTYRLDGFVSIDAADGELLTAPMRPTGDRLIVNGATQAGGSLRVELLDDAGRPIPGYSLDDAEPLSGDEVDHVCRWRGRDAVAPLRDRVAVQARFVLRGASLYSMRWGG